MGNNWLKKKEECSFYNDIIKYQNFSCDKNFENISSSEIKIIIYHINCFSLRIINYEKDIFRLIFDLLDTSLKYKPETDIGNNLKQTPFSEIKEENDILYIKNNSNNILKVYFNKFKIEYFFDSELLFTLNEKQTLSLLYNKTTELRGNYFDFSFKNFPILIGLSERVSSLILKDDSYRLFNTDNKDQVVGSPQPTYGSIPLIHAINSEKIFTLFNNNCTDSWVEISTSENNKNVNWISEAGIIDLYLFCNKDYEKQINTLCNITGFAPLCPLYSLGYHICRWGFKDTNDIEEVSKKYDELNIPYDVFWLDIDHTNEKRYFTWDEKNFKGKEQFLERINKENRNLVLIIDPHIKKDDNYEINKILLEKDLYIKTKNKNNELEPFIGFSWPTFSYFIDVLNYDKLLEIYKNFYKREDYFLGYKNIGIWVDMNEPSVFDKSNENSMVKSNYHTDNKGTIVQHKDIHNLYGQLYHKLSYNSLKNRYDNKLRPFILSRSFYAGSQKYGFIWTGDNKSNKDFLNISIENNLVNGLCGISACGSDVGGFFGAPSNELLKNWYNLGNLYVFYRGHSSLNSKRREPWLYGEETLNYIRECIKERYNILLYFYTKFYEYTVDGGSILKPIFFVFRKDFDKLIKLKAQSSLFCVGKEILCINYDTLCDVGKEFLKNLKEKLYYLKDGKLKKDFEENKEIFEKFIIGGNIIPWTENIFKNSYEVVKQPISLKIFLNENLESKGNLYYDDGISLNVDNDFIYLNIKFENNELKIENKNKEYNINESKFKDTIPIWNKIEIYGLNKKIEKINLEKFNIIYDSELDYNMIEILELKIKINNDLIINFLN